MQLDPRCLWIAALLGVAASCADHTVPPSHDGGADSPRPDGSTQGDAGASACSWQPVIAGFDVPSITALVADPAQERLLIFSDPPAASRTTAVELGATPRLRALAPSGDAPPGDLASASIALDSGRARVLLYGGRNLDAVESRVFAMTLDANPIWSVLEVASEAPARTEHGAAVDAAGRRMFVFGGFRDETSAHADVFALELDAPRWERITTSGPAPEGRFDLAAVWDAGRDRLLVRGGRQPRVLRDQWALQPTPDSSWQELAPDPPLPALAVTNTSIADIYDPIAGAWLVIGVRDVLDAPPGPRELELFRMPLAGAHGGFSKIATQHAPPASSVSSDYPAAHDAEADRLYVAINWSNAGRANEIWMLPLANCR